MERIAHSEACPHFEDRVAFERCSCGANERARTRISVLRAMHDLSFAINPGGAEFGVHGRGLSWSDARCQIPFNGNDVVDLRALEAWLARIGER